MTSKYWKRLTNITLNSKFRQKQLLTEDAFLDYCKKRDLNLSKETLSYLRKNGLFQPVLTLQITSGISLDYTSLQYYFQEGLIIHHKNKETQNKGTTRIYHPYQIILLRTILESFSITLPPPYTLTNISATNTLISKFIKSNKKRIRSFVKYQLIFHLKILALLFSIEGNYLPDIRKNFSTSAFNKFGYPEWVKYHKRYSPIDVIKKLDTDKVFIKNAYEKLDTDVHFLDPLYDWYSLIRYFPIKKREGLLGKALFAQLYYEVLDVLRSLFSDLPGQTQLLGNYERETQWLSKTLGKNINYERYDVLAHLLSEYGINPSLKVLVYIEGETECAVITKLLEDNHITIENIGLKVENLHGVGGFDYKRLTHHLDYLLKNNTDCFFILDPEGEAIRQKDKLIKRFPYLNDKITIWKKDFERDNFTTKEIAEGLSEYSKSIYPSPITFTNNDVVKAKTLRNLFCGKTNNCPKMFTCKFSSEKVSKCHDNSLNSDRLNKPAFGLLMASRYLSSRTLRKNHPSMKEKGIIKTFNKILHHATSRKVHERP